MTRTYEFNANMYIYIYSNLYICSHRNGLFHLISAHPMSRVHVVGVPREGFQPQKPETLTEKFQLEKREHLRNSSIRNLNPCGIWVLKTWTPRGIPAWKTLPKPPRHTSIKNLNLWGIPVSKTWTCEEFQTQILTLVEFQPQKYWSLRNSSLNC